MLQCIRQAHLNTFASKARPTYLFGTLHREKQIAPALHRQVFQPQGHKAESQGSQQAERIATYTYSTLRRLRYISDFPEIEILSLSKRAETVRHVENVFRISNFGMERLSRNRDHLRPDTHCGSDEITLLR